MFEICLIKWIKVDNGKLELNGNNNDRMIGAHTVMGNQPNNDDAAA